VYQITDYKRELISHMEKMELENPAFNLGDWYSLQIACHKFGQLDFHETSEPEAPNISEPVDYPVMGDPLDLFGVQVDRNKYPSLQRNAAVPKDQARVLPKPVIVTVQINGQPA